MPKSFLIVHPILAAIVSVCLCTAVVAQEDSGLPDDAKNGVDAEVGGEPSDGPSTSSLEIPQGEAPQSVKEQTEAEILASLPPEVLKAGQEAKAEFMELKSKLIRTMVDMRAVHIRFQNEEDRSPEAMEQYRQHRNDARDLMNDLFLKGLDVIRQMPDVEVVQYLLTIIEHRMKFDYFDAASMEVGARLIDNGFPNNFLYPATMRAAIVNGDFVLAKRLIEALDLEKLTETDQKLAFAVDALEEQYKRDQELQKQDDEKNNNPRAKMVTTRGEVTIELFINQAPSTVANFIQLVEKGYYDGLDFYQVIDHLLALTGDESGNGMGNSGKFLRDEHDRPDARQGLAGSLVMAKHPLADGKFAENSASTQFAILFLPIPSVSQAQTVFGRVIKGMDVIGELRRVDPSKKKKKNEIVMPPDRVLSIEMIRRPETLPEVDYIDIGSLMKEHAGHSHGPAMPPPAE